MSALRLPCSDAGNSGQRGLMVNLVRLKRMIALASYEKGAGKKDLAICRYYKGDYLTLKMIGTFFLTTFAYILILALLFAANLASILENITKMNFVITGSEILIGYIVLEAVFLTVTFVSGASRYNKARRRVKSYIAGIRRLLQSSEEER